MPLFLLALAPAEPPEQDILVTASREPIAAEAAAASSSQIEARTIEALALPAVADLLRFVPGLSVASSGPRGSQTQVRIRGAEANHSLLFVDGIRFNDPASGNEPRFELLSADLAARIEIVRGPQSALWGSEALGGVVAVETPDPLTTRGLAGLAEAGSLESLRLAGRYGFGSDRSGLVASAAWQRSEGVDSLGGGGDRDGHDNLSLGLRAAHQAGPIRIGFSAFHVEGLSRFDGTDRLSFRRADTKDATRNRIDAVRAGADLEFGRWSVRAEASWLDSANRNRLGHEPVNATFGERLAFGGQVARRAGPHLLILGFDHQREGFRARDRLFSGATEQRRRRRTTGLVAEWRAQWHERISTDLAVRHDVFSAFADATTLRASLQLRPTASLAFHAAYGEGIAQPTFYDLYGFFPGSFRGNDALRPEQARGWEAGLSWSRNAFSAGATWFRSRLRDEIVDTFDPATFLSGTANAGGTSRREGVELSAGWRPDRRLNLQVAYTFLEADEQQVAGSALVREVRRPRHSLGLIAEGRIGSSRFGLGLSYVGTRRDLDFDAFPARPVRLSDYLLVSATLARRILPSLEAYVRVENGLDADYQDVVGYHTAGRSFHAGLRLAFGD